MHRRKFIKQASGLLAGSFAVPYINTNRCKIFDGIDTEYSVRTIRLIRESVVIDMLNQFRYGESLEKWLKDPRLFKNEAEAYQTSGIDVFALGHGQPDKKSALDYFSRWDSLISANAEYLYKIEKTDDLELVNKNGKTGILMSFQRSDHFESVDDVALFYEQGQRISQLTYNYDNKIGSGAFSDIDKGLSDFGREIIVKMNEAGMAIDLSHCSDKTTIEGIELSEKPALITHANCRALNPGYVRAKTDDMIKKLAEKEGLFGVSAIRFMIRDREPVNVSHWLEHVDHVIDLVGPEFVGIGSDMDMPGDENPYWKQLLQFIDNDTTGRFLKWKIHTTPEKLTGVKGINGSKRMFDMVEAMIDHGYSDNTIELILGRNFIRFTESVWK
jgi:membrane dipeptidase